MQLNMVDQVDFIGWTDQAIEYNQKSKVLVLPSQTESFGLVIGEALLNGTQVVTITAVKMFLINSSPQICRQV